MKQAIDQITAELRYCQLTMQMWKKRKRKNKELTNIANSPCQCEPMEVEGAVGGCGTANN